MRNLMLMLVMTAMPALVQASTPDWRVELGGGGRWVTDPAYDLVSQKDLADVFSLAAGWTPGWVDDRLTLRLGYVASGSTAQVFSSWTASLTNATFDAGARYDFARSGRAMLYARGAVTLDVAHLELDSPSGPAVSDTSFVPGVAAAVGGEVSLNAPDSTSSVRFSILTEAGWAQRLTQASFDELTTDVDETLEPSPIASSPVDVGDLSLSGPFFRVALALRF